LLIVDRLAPSPPLSWALYRRPALAAGVLLIVGIIVSFDVPVAPWIWVGAAVIGAMLAGCAGDRGGIGNVLLAVSVISVGVTLGQTEFTRFEPNDIAAFTSERATLAQLEVHLDQAPRLSVHKAHGSPISQRQSVIAEVRGILTHEGWIQSSGRIMVQLAQANAGLAAGQNVRVVGMLGRIGGATNPAEFDWAEHYRQQRLIGLLRVAKAEEAQIVGSENAGWSQRLRDGACDMLAMGFDGGHLRDFSLLQALVLGENDPTAQANRQQFQNLGAVYLLSISGMHLAVLAGCVYLMCRMLLLSPRRACWICVVVVIAYGQIVTAGVSTVRAELLSVGLLLGILMGRDVDKIQLLALVVGAQLCFAPMEVFSPGFQLGSVCILGMLVLAPPMLRWLGDRDRLDGDLSFQEIGIGRRVWISLRTWIALSLIAWVVTLPIVAFDFGQISWLAIPSGVVLFPITGLALVGGCLKMLITFGWPSVAPEAAHLARVPISLMGDTAALIGRAGTEPVHTIKPGLMAIAIYYVLIAVPLIRWPGRILPKLAATVAALGVCLMVGGLCFGFPPLRIHSGGAGLEITFCDVGVGQCAVIQPAGVAPLVIDAGSSTAGDFGESILMPLLEARGVRAIGDVILSNSAVNRVSGACGVVAAMGRPGVYTSHYFARFARNDTPAQGLLNQLQRGGRSIRLLTLGDHLAIPGDVAVDVLWPPAECSFKGNDTSLVIRLTYGHRRVLFAGDIQSDAIHTLLNSRADLKADVLVAPHQGSAEIITPAFIAAVDPRIIVSSDAEPLTQKQKHLAQIIGRRKLYRTSECGAITVRVSAGGEMGVESFLTGS
jgi:competence protein ComEC